MPAVVAGYMRVADLATGILAAAPGAVDFVTTVRPAGGRSVVDSPVRLVSFREPALLDFQLFDLRLQRRWRDAEFSGRATRPGYSALTLRQGCLDHVLLLILQCVRQNT